MSGKESAASGSATLNDNQMKFLASMMKNTRSKPDIDWDKVAAESGLTSKSAKERYRVMSNKFGWNAKSGGDGVSSSPKTPKKTAGVTKRIGRVGDTAKKGRGKKAAAQEDDDNEDGKDESELEDAGET